MIAKQLYLIDYMTCGCGKNPRMIQTGDRYHVEAYCCKTITIPLKTERAALNEFRRLRAVQVTDPDTWPEDNVPASLYAVPKRTVA